MRVGTRTDPYVYTSYFGDHPHACGDKNWRCAVRGIFLGSSPCVWGQENNTVSDRACVRIIPMRVGTSLIFPSPLHRGQDHPHACGDKLPCGVSLVKLSGSSPCVWGQGADVCRSQPCNRIIPMRVGTRATERLSVSTDRDHPHACGDKDKR